MKKCHLRIPFRYKDQISSPIVSNLQTNVMLSFSINGHSLLLNFDQCLSLVNSILLREEIFFLHREEIFEVR